MSASTGGTLLGPIWSWLAGQLSAIRNAFAPRAASAAAPPAGVVFRSYYYVGGQRVAMRLEGESDPAKNGLFHLLSDHLGSTTVTLKDSGSLSKVGELRYMPWGNNRASGYAESLTPTDKRFTGQRWEAISSTGLYHYGARWYDPMTGRFTQPDSIVPDPYNAQDWDRYAYVRNNPAKFTDPSGHCVFGVDTVVCLLAGGALIGAAVAYGTQVYDNYQQGATGIDAWVSNVDGTKVLEGAVIGAGVVVGGIAAGAVVTAGVGALGGAATAACADGDCTNEATAVGNRVSSLVSAACSDGDCTNEVSAVEQAANKTTTAIQTYYPPSLGFSGTPQVTTLQPGVLVSRYGSTYGTFLSPARTPTWARSLPPGVEKMPLNTYQVAKPISNVLSGKISPWWGRIGGGIQYYIGSSHGQNVQTLLNSGYLKPYPE